MVKSGSVNGDPEVGLTEVGEELLTRGEELKKEMVVVRG